MFAKSFFLALTMILAPLAGADQMHCRTHNNESVMMERTDALLTNHGYIHLDNRHFLSLIHARQNYAHDGAYFVYNHETYLLQTFLVQDGSLVPYRSLWCK